MAPRWSQRAAGESFRRSQNRFQRSSCVARGTWPPDNAMRPAMPSRLDDFKAIVACDFEFDYGTGGSSEGPPHVICGCARELRSGQEYYIWSNEFGNRPPWPHEND